MSSEPTTSRSGLSRQARRRLGASLPWLTWTAALGVALWLGGGVLPSGIAPAEAERVVVVLSSPRTAAVTSLAVAPGDRVEAGAVVATLDPSDLDLEIAVAEGELERMRLEVNAEGTSLHVEQLETRERLASDAEKAAVEAARLEAEVGRDRAELSTIEEQLARQRKLVDEGIASGANLDDLEVRRAALAKKVSEYERLLRRARDHLGAARARLAEWERTGDAGAPRTAPLVAAVKAQEDRVKALEAARDKLTLRAPVAARVQAVHEVPGGVAVEGGPVVTLLDERPRRVIAWLPEDRARLVEVGDVARLAPSDRVGAVRHGRVVALGPGLEDMPIRFRQIPQEPELARAVYIELDDQEAPPLPGQAFDARFLSRAP